MQSTDKLTQEHACKCMPTIVVIVIIIVILTIITPIEILFRHLANSALKSINYQVTTSIIRLATMHNNIADIYTHNSDSNKQ